MNHFSFFVNLLGVGWGTTMSPSPVVPNADTAVSSCSLDMANLSLDTG